MTITCADCGTTQTIPPLPPRAVAQCQRCDRNLSKHRAGGMDFNLACSAAVLILLPPAVFMPLMDSTIRHLVFQESRLVSSVPVIYSEVWFPFAFGFLFLAFLFPALRALFQLLVLGSLRTGWRVPQLGRLFRWSEELKIWSMTDVVVIAGVASYYRAAVPAEVSIGVGGWIYVALAVLIFASDRTLDRRAVWNAIRPDPQSFPGPHPASCFQCELTMPEQQSGHACPRCGARLDPNVARRFAPALGAIAASIPLSVPAYSAAIMINDQLTGVLEHTVIGTIQLLADHGFWQFGVVILVAGIVVPVTVMITMAWLLARVRFPSRRGLVVRTRAYRIMHRLVRWPMIIPFIAAITAPIVDFRGIDDIVAGPGATPLFMLIVLLMLAVRLFEPRLMWKTAGEAE
jgi:paraquat-inducible protein A